MAVAKFSIVLEKADDGSVAVRVRNGDAIPAHTVAADSLAAIRRQVSALMDAFEDGHRPIADPVALAEIGAQLRAVFLTPFAGAIDSAVAQGPVRLLFTSSDPECLNLPWELLPGPNGRFLVADARCAIRRSTRAELAPASPSLAAPPLRILFTACAPTDQPGLDYEKEEEAILRIAQKLGGRVHLEIAEAGTFDELRELIVEHRPHIVHLSGHGSVHEGICSFAFNNESGR